MCDGTAATKYARPYQAAYRDNYDRLVELEDEWDPENQFRPNQNVEPTG